MKKEKPIVKCTLTPNEMWKLSGNNHIDMGIEGYVLPKEILDVRGILWRREREKILDPKNRRKFEPKTDRDGNIIKPPKRPNYLDDITKWANSFYDKEKAAKTLEEADGKGHPLLEPLKPKPFYVPTEKPKKREFFTDLLIREEAKKYI